MSKPNLVLVHGWGLNEEVWFNLLGPLSEVYEVHNLSLPGYGKRHKQATPHSLEALAEELLDEAPQTAIWFGWSLGGMAALTAALNQPERVSALHLLCVTPKFVKSDDWAAGTDMPTFSKFAQSMADNYRRGILRFLLLQSGTSTESKSLAKLAGQALGKHPSPSSETLMAGLALLEQADLRPELPNLRTPCTVISGRRDRVTPPEACKFLAEQIPGARHVLLNSGHAPHLSHAEELLELLITDSSSASEASA